MSVSDQAVSFAYETDGASVAYAFPSYFRAPADLVVTFKNSTGVVVTKTLTTDYTVSGAVDPKLKTYSAGGTVTFGVPLAAGGQVRITRRTPKTQPSVFTQGDPSPAGSNEVAHDIAMLVIQEALKSIGCLGVADGPPTSGSFNAGDWYKNSAIVAGGSLGWIYDGAAWREFAQVSG